jgi:hypothetical protein
VKRRDYLGNLGVNRGIILKVILKYMCWVQLGEGTGQCWVLVNIVVSFRFTYGLSNCLPSRTTVGALRQALIHNVW